ncbi:hypothetical protein EC991_006739 [Linnemannia zychae]|nr:hypothetical protein EC991_006739 [Linnemannia zychae]
MKIISITAAVLVVALAIVQAAPFPQSGILTKKNTVDVKAPTNIDLSDVRIVSRDLGGESNFPHGITVGEHGSPINVDKTEVPIRVGDKSITIGKRGGSLVNVEDVKIPIDVRVKNINVL